MSLFFCLWVLAGCEGWLADDIPLVLKPIPTAHLKAADVDELTRTTRELMLKELVALTATPAGQRSTNAELGPGDSHFAVVRKTFGY